MQHLSYEVWHVDIVRAIVIALCVYSSAMTIMAMYCFSRNVLIKRRNWIKIEPEEIIRIYIQTAALLGLYLCCTVDMLERFGQPPTWRTPAYLVIFTLFAVAQDKWYKRHRRKRLATEQIIAEAKLIDVSLEGE